MHSLDSLQFLYKPKVVTLRSFVIIISEDKDNSLVPSTYIYREAADALIGTLIDGVTGTNF